jgi:hypothetical protein
MFMMRQEGAAIGAYIQYRARQRLQKPPGIIERPDAKPYPSGTLEQHSGAVEILHARGGA